MNTYPHMCRDGHVEIGHADSSSEMCPMCRLKSVLEDAADMLNQRCMKFKGIITENPTTELIWNERERMIEDIAARAADVLLDMTTQKVLSDDE